MMKKLNKIEYLFYLIGIFIALVTLIINTILVDATIDIPVHDTYYIIKNTYISFFISTILIVSGGIYHIISLTTKKRLIKSLNITHLVLSCFSFLIFLFPLFLVGLPRAPRRYYSNTENSHIEYLTDLNFLVQISIYLFIIAQLIFITNIILTLLKKRNENNLL